MTKLHRPATHCHAPKNPSPPRRTRFQGQEERFGGHSPRIAGQGSVGSHHPVAGDHEDQRIDVAGAADGPGSPGASHLCGDLPVRAGLPIGYPEKRLPYRPGKCAALPSERKVELPALPGKIFPELGGRLREEVRALQDFPRRKRASAEKHFHQPGVFFCRTHPPDGGFEIVHVLHRFLFSARHLTGKDKPGGTSGQTVSPIYPPRQCTSGARKSAPCPPFA